MVSEGWRGDTVRTIQRVLTQAGAYDGLVDGWWGPRTTGAVEHFQRSVGVPVTGRWDPTTLARTRKILDTSSGIMPAVAPRPKETR